MLNVYDMLHMLKNRQNVRLFTALQRYCSTHIPFVSMYEKNTGLVLTSEKLEMFKRKHPNIDKLTYEQLENTLSVLKKFDITSNEACLNPHVFCMNPITMDNYGEILRECGFMKVLPNYIIKYHTLVKSRTIANLKKKGLISDKIRLQERLREYFKEWPVSKDTYNIEFDESVTSILQVRMHTLQSYLKWRLHATSEDFEKYCRNYLPLKHRPMTDIQKAIEMAINDLQFDVTAIRRNGFLICTDPVHTKLILENVASIGGLSIRDAVKKEPAILRNNYLALLEIQNILKEYGIGEEAQQRNLKVFCIKPDTVRERLEELRGMREFQLLATNPRVLFLVVHKKKMMSRLEKMQAANKQCFSLNHLVGSTKVFNTYINNFGSKSCSRDLAIFVATSLLPPDLANDKSTTTFIHERFKRHKYWLHAALSVVDENIKYLQRLFRDSDILDNCQLLLYPLSEIEHYLKQLLQLRQNGGGSRQMELEGTYHTLDGSRLTDSQLLSLTLYEIEKKHYFTGDGIWNKSDAQRMEQSANS